MPYGEFRREQDWLLPPSLGELLAADHPVRFVAEFVDLLDLKEVGIRDDAPVEGAPRYRPQVLLVAWLYGFMVHVRSSRKLERACRENIAFMWLTGMQRPDHVTLWRFYQAHRPVMRQLLKQTVQQATEVGLVDFALQAVDGSRVTAASPDSLRERETVEHLLARVEAEITAMEQDSQSEPGPDGRPPTGPTGLSGKQALRARLQDALQALAERSSRPTASQTAAGPAPPGGHRPAAWRCAVSVSDPEAIPSHGRHGCGVGYNGQAVVDSKAQIVVAAAVVAAANDNHQLVAMLDEVQAMTGRQPTAVVADTGYLVMADLLAAQRRGVEAIVPDRRAWRADAPDKNPYHKEHFVYDPLSDSFTCPEGRRLHFKYVTHWGGQAARCYSCRSCVGCAAQASGACTAAKVRSLAVFGHEQDLKAHAAKMKTAWAQALLRRRKVIVEPVFAVFREQIGLRRFLVRGLGKAQAEWRLVCVAHNLRKLYTLWWRPRVLAQAGSS